jgi:hypothetical protein
VIDYGDLEREAKREVQRKLDAVFSRYAGQPVAEVIAALERESFTEPELSQLASAISEERQPKVH